ncbi:MAG: response regulator [Spirochaetales bacterium]|nr:response regulator [Spirochaetales bacterium]
MKRTAILTFTLFLISCSAPFSGTETERGILDLSGYDFSETVDLSGTWLFAPEHVGRDFDQWSEIEVPSPWRKDIKEGTYKLEIELPSVPDHYSLYIPDCPTAYELMLNDQIYYNGNIGDDYKPTLKPGVFQISTGGHLSIILKASDFHTSHSGLISQPYFGRSALIEKQALLNSSIDAISIGALILSGIFSLGAWLADRKNKENSHHILALIAFWMIIRFLTDYNRLILLFMDNYTVHEKLTWFNIPVIVALFALYFKRIFDYPPYQKLMDWSIALSLLYGLAVLAGPVRLAYLANVPYELVMIIPMTATIYMTIYDIFYGKKTSDSLYWLGVMIGGIIIFGGNALFQFQNSVFNTRIFAALIIPFQILFTYIPYRKVYERNSILLKHKNDLFMRLSDSLRTPLFGITGKLDLLMNSRSCSAEVRDELREMESCAQKLSDHIDYLLSVSRADVISRNPKGLIRDPLARTNIILIDDVEINRSILREQIRQVFRNATVHVFDSAEMALTHMESNRVDCIFCDLLMPGMDGFQFTQSCRKKGYLTPIFIFSASMNRENRLKALSYGADGYLEKPLKLKEIKELFSLYI